MLRWYRNLVREHGMGAATQLLWRVGRQRVTGRVANRMLPGKVLCPCCGWQGRKFYDYIDVGYMKHGIECPRCYSHPRHRALYLWLKEDFRLQEREGAALVFAPEKALASVWGSASSLRATKVDIERARGVDVLADLQCLPFASDSVDLAWCHHVLTHVRDDRAAMRELHRVLRPEAGELILSVAMNTGAETQEFGLANKSLPGFWRVYGDDFAERLAEHGFNVRAVNFELPPEDCKRYGIRPQERFYVCTKERASSVGLVQ